MMATLKKKKKKSHDFISAMVEVKFRSRKQNHWFVLTDVTQIILFSMLVHIPLCGSCFSVCAEDSVRFTAQKKNRVFASSPREQLSG